jgi:CTP:molybdopterin cytidylyltransferase MocA
MSLPPGRGFIAPWWISPAVAYWSGQPGVGGSSHQSLAGIADTAKFFISVDPQEAQTILNLRKSTWVVVDDPVRTLSTSAQLLGTDALPGSMGNLLFSGDVPPRLDLTLIKNSGFYQLYRKN